MTDSATSNGNQRTGRRESTPGLRVFVTASAARGSEDERGQGTPARPYRSVADALADAGLRLGSNSARKGPGPSSLEIVYIDQPGQAPSRVRKPRYEYFLQVDGVVSSGDGSEAAPWPTLEAARDGVSQLHSTGKLMLHEGDSIRFSPRGMFTPTRLEKWKQRKETAAKLVFLSMALMLVVPVLAIIGYLTFRAWPALNPDFLLTNPRAGFTAGGVWAPLIGTFMLVLLSLAIAAPIGVLAGVYLNEYARDNWFTRMINLAVVNLAGVPSIVHGLFGVGAFVVFAGMGKSLLAAGATLAVMTLPVIIASTREALASVPMSFREACWNMGASRWQTIRTIVLPNSISGILTGVILQVARAAGETAPILFTGVAVTVRVKDSGWESFLPFGLGDRFMALSNHLFVLSKQAQDAPPETVYGTAVVLIALVLVVNSLSIGLRVYLRSRKKW